jgi:hypothetical protein
MVSPQSVVFFWEVVENLEGGDQLEELGLWGMSLTVIPVIPGALPSLSASYLP